MAALEADTGARPTLALRAYAGKWRKADGSPESDGERTSNGSVQFSTEAGQRLTEFCQENALVIADTLYQQHKRRLYTWTSPDGQYRNQIDYILCGQRWRSSIASAKTRPGAECGSDHELLVANFRHEWRPGNFRLTPWTARWEVPSYPLSQALSCAQALSAFSPGLLEATDKDNKSSL